MPRPGFDSRHGRLKDVLNAYLDPTNHSSMKRNRGNHAHNSIPVRTHFDESNGYSV